MKVAIIGAGLSGLSCAYELQKHGIIPEIFEKTSLVGENLRLPVILLKMLDTPIRNPLKYLKKNFGIPLTPNYEIKQLTTITQHKTTVVNKHIGWIFRRGSMEGTMNMQIRNLVTAPITTEKPINFKEIKNQYDHVVIASGSLSEAEEMNILQLTFSCYTRIATVVGKFRTDSVTIWFNTEYAKNSYAYLIPDTETEASLVIIANDIKAHELDTYWEKFLNTEKINLKITQTKDFNHKVGTCSSVQIGNLYFAGFAGGFIDDFIGVGSPYAVMSGALAARAIVEGKNYTEIMAPFTKDMKQKHVLRDSLNLFSNKEYDAMNSIMGSYLGQFLAYGNPIYRVTQIVPFARIYNKMKRLLNKNQDKS